jgi:hypothetical protein
MTMAAIANVAQTISMAFGELKKPSFDSALVFSIRQ